jgi:hypothetical protein
MVAPSLQTEGKHLQSAQGIGMGARSSSSSAPRGTNGNGGGAGDGDVPAIDPATPAMVSSAN